MSALRRPRPQETRIAVSFTQDCAHSVGHCLNLAWRFLTLTDERISVSSDAIVDISPAAGIEPVQPSIDISEAAALPYATAEADRPYSDADLALFHELTGYRLMALETIWVVVDDEGKRAPFADRLFTTLAEEAFRFADRRRRSGSFPNEDLTLDDLMGALGPLQRIAAEIGSRGVSAFRRLEAVLAARNQPPVGPPLETLAALSAG